MKPTYLPLKQPIVKLRIPWLPWLVWTLWFLLDPALNRFWEWGWNGCSPCLSWPGRWGW